jgi:hypothetical protein
VSILPVCRNTFHVKSIIENPTFHDLTSLFSGPKPYNYHSLPKQKS